MFMRAAYRSAQHRASETSARPAVMLVDGAPLDPGPVEAWALRQALRARIEAQEREARAAEARQRANGGCAATRRWVRDACAGLMATPPGGRHDALRAVGALVGHVHFADSNRRAVGFGHTDVGPIVAALRELGYACFLL